MRRSIESFLEHMPMCLVDAVSLPKGVLTPSVGIQALANRLVASAHPKFASLVYRLCSFRCLPSNFRQSGTTGASTNQKSSVFVLECLLRFSPPRASFSWAGRSDTAARSRADVEHVGLAAQPFVGIGSRKGALRRYGTRHPTPRIPFSFERVHILVSRFL